jgi:hypothetical protein
LFGSPTAVAVLPGVFDAEYFRTYAVTNSIGWKFHNIALKWFRDELEAAGSSDMLFSNTNPHPVPQIVHEKGPLYSFDRNSIASPWRWQDMVGQLDAESLQLLLEYHDRSRGIVSCQIRKTDRYDHARHHALKHLRASPDMLLIWDFVLLCEDGTEVFLHPNYSDKKIAAFIGEPQQDHEVPRTGLGGTSGKGTFKYFKNKFTTATLRFGSR